MLQKKTEPAKMEQRCRKVRICESCGAENPANARKCSGCNEDISDIIPTEQGANSGLASMISIDGACSFVIPEGETVIGGENTMKEYLESRTYVSGRQCRLFRTSGKLTVTDLDSKNGTYVNNVLITAETMLKAGDELGLGGCKLEDGRQEKAAYFIIEEGQCTSQGSCTP